MKTRLRRFAALMFTAALVLTATGATARAQNRFVPVTEGIQDTQTGLVWGYTYLDMDYVYTVSLGGGIEFVALHGSPWNGGSADVADYQVMSNALFNRNDTWRLPTLAEAQAAEQAGIGVYLNTGLGTPLNAGYYYWTATPKNKKYAYAYDFAGDALPFPVGNYLDFIPVHAGN